MYSTMSLKREAVNFAPQPNQRLMSKEIVKRIIIRKQEEEEEDDGGISRKEAIQLFWLRLPDSARLEMAFKYPLGRKA